MAEISVELVAVERRLWSGKATMVIAQTTEGELGVLPGHEPLLGQLVEGGVVKIRTTDGDTVIAAVYGGFLSITGDGVSILAENAELADEIDIEQARAEVAAAQDADERARAAARVRAAGQTV
ncbi:F0F1 ATP synthase subunit epsilon [Kibdelosporangium phytohabitans]|uniref:ATP synthase epsilon chain n=1 Tax=Kibdelosporangium phytohabitans TaxID=860235 RepID=A0A0N9I0N5_9PSEU|nr:F0F1 ATP synthase subunit epsilon [Kibdelosporangium phytohabitans]ALG13297.1 ATP synthase F0F1 subunit epsilon [Kibdelosporangium phytohabitans]MBE1465073.1 F-type H+-transporting ATPase subunit epsilon [Kibdelosporangium phytohabitans]